MSDFVLWFGTGLEHILDLDGYDHILYIVALTIIFHLYQWKQLLILVTAFTLGHSVTLAMSTSNLIQMPQSVVEIWIAVTILVSCLWNIKDLKKEITTFRARYVTAVLFGCIHGLGFSYLLKSMLGQEQSIFFPLLYFNLGLEAGQLVILSILVVFKYIIQLSWPKGEIFFTTTITFVILLLSLHMLSQRLFFQS